MCVSLPVCLFFDDSVLEDAVWGHVSVPHKLFFGKTALRSGLFQLFGGEKGTGCRRAAEILMPRQPQLLCFLCSLEIHTAGIFREKPVVGI